ncbi:MAG: hypothetical protein KAW89_04075 [Armatimonadetes bacterium]|nr:hypothetical protein [Armatimonadota bacterium]
MSQLKNGVVLAEIGSHSNGPWCARHGAGAALVVLGTFIVDARDEVPYNRDFVFKPGRENYGDYLNEHVAAARDSGAAVGVSVASVNLDDTIDFLLAAQGAGADYLSLCIHSSMEMFVSEGLGVALLRRENWPKLEEHVTAIMSATDRPFIPKFGVSGGDDAEQAVEVMAGVGVNIFHVNVGDAPSEHGKQIIGRLRQPDRLLIIGGGIRTSQQARQVIAAGADAVAVASAAMDDPQLCGRMQVALQG